MCKRLVLSIALATGLVMVSIAPSWAEFSLPIPSNITGPLVDKLIQEAEHQTEIVKNEVRKKAKEELEKQLAKLDQELKERIQQIREKAKG